jgi:hypothetical protein
MELTGDLDDFALADILQIMALSRKTGTVILESEEQKGRILLEHGKITYAALTSVESFAERIIRTRGVSKNVLQELLGIGARSEGVWGFDTLVIESGILEDTELMADVRNHVRAVLTNMLAVHKGRFNILLNQAIIPNSYQEIVLRKGLDVGEVLIEAARHSDEKNRRASLLDSDQEGFTDSAENFGEEVEDRPSDNERDFTHPAYSQDRQDERRLKKFCSLIAELNAQCSESDITLLLMRYAGELISRAVLFSVGKEDIFGLGQFGIGMPGLMDNNRADGIVRNLRIPIISNCVLSTVARTSRPCIGKLKDNYWDREVLGRIGGINPELTVVAIPLICDGRVKFILYGDNYPGEKLIEGIEELVAFAHLAGIILEKIKLSEEHKFSRI